MRDKKFMLPNHQNPLVVHPLGKPKKNNYNQHSRFQNLHFTVILISCNKLFKFPFQLQWLY